MQSFESVPSSGGMTTADDAHCAPDAALLGEWLPVCNSADVPAGKLRGFVVAGERLVVWRSASEADVAPAQPDISTDVHVWRDRCPHPWAQLSLASVPVGLASVPAHGVRAVV